MPTALAPELRHLVKESVTLFGQVLKTKLGIASYNRIEKMRQTMTTLRNSSVDREIQALKRQYKILENLSSKDQYAFAQSFALMLELMNTCENAYRSHQIKNKIYAGSVASGRHRRPEKELPNSIVYVLTAHPTEARAPYNIWVFQEVLKILTAVIARDGTLFLESERILIRHLLEIAWNTSMVRTKKPQVRDEAEHIYSTLLREETLRPLLHARAELAPIFVRSWVGGDKDGHPGVDEKVFLESLQLSRLKLRQFVSARLRAVQSVATGIRNQKISKACEHVRRQLRFMTFVKTGDAGRVLRFRKSLSTLSKIYTSVLGSPHPELLELDQLFAMFPALVVPLEFRESSDVLMNNPSGKGLAIHRMLRKLAMLSRGGDPRWYVREFIVSMAECIDHIRVAANLVQQNFGRICLPIVPLFEQARAQDMGVTIIGQMLDDPALKKALRNDWNNSLQIMLGYSDSSKESGVLPSRLKVAETMYALDKFCRHRQVTPVFFQGSGGSVDRGGGSIEEQTSWWSSGALKNYKVTIQGEMVERSLANPEITWSQLAKITEFAGGWKKAQSRKLPKPGAVDDFAAKVAQHYQTQVKADDFLLTVQMATPYSFLNLINIGSRPSKRTKTVSLAGLRAIPWILCWTQTRILFPVWWGVGSAWEESSPAQKKEMVAAYKHHPVFRIYVKALGYTLVKVELAIWRMYLDESLLSTEEKQKSWSLFSQEYKRTLRCARALIGERDLIGWRPWLAESIHLRSPMIHPLNLLQILAMKNKDVALLRVTVAGISSGMMTTG